MEITVESLSDLLGGRFGGVLRAGRHDEDGECCAIELLSAARGLPWTDAPGAVGAWDLRPLNDADVPDAVRTECILPVLAAYADARGWPPDRQIAVASRLAILTVRRIVADLPGVAPETAERCRRAATVEEARLAASAAKASPGHPNLATGYAATAATYAKLAETGRAADAPRAAAGAAEFAAEAAGSAVAASRTAWAADLTFRAACDVWMGAYREVADENS